MDDGCTVASRIRPARRRFLGRSAARGIGPVPAERAWSDVLRFSSYSFNRAHTLSQALLGYQTAFLKTHAPLELGRALLDHHGGLYPRRVIAAELARRGVRLLPPSILSSRHGCSIARHAQGDALRIGLGLIARLRAVTRQRILAARADGGLAMTDLPSKLRPEPRELRALVESGALDELFELGPNDHPWVHDALLRRLLRDADGRDADGRDGVLDRGAIDATIARAREQLPREPAELVDRYRRLCRVQRELEHLGMHVSDHPMRILRSEAERVGCVPSARLHEHAGERVVFAGVIAATRRVPLAGPARFPDPADAAGAGGAGGAAASGSPAIAQFVTLEDEHGLVEARLSARGYERWHAVLTTPGPYLIEAEVREQQGAISLDILRVFPFHERPTAP